ncbi:MAG: hypothetical protein GC204_20765 [Chloroflexi bacterium]|nr:hypothetical protein [Chloroflexota bacterium]
MISHISARFRKAFQELPQDVRQQAREAYQQFARDPYYPSLHFKRVHSKKPIYSVRVSDQYRALGVRNDDEMLWFWIGSHAEYDRLLSQI